MPLYDFRCLKCEEEFEALSGADQSLDCIKCGAPECERQIPLVNINRPGYLKRLRLQTGGADLDKKMRDKQKDNFKMLSPERKRKLLGGFEKQAVRRKAE